MCPFFLPSHFVFIQRSTFSQELNSEGMQEPTASTSNGVEGYGEEWLNNEWAWFPGRPLVQPSSMLLSSTIVQPTCQAPCFSSYYDYNHTVNHPSLTIEHPAQSPGAQYHHPASVSPHPIVQQQAPIPVSPPAPVGHLQTAQRDISGSPTVVSRPPVPASQSPPILPVTVTQNSSSSLLFKLPPQKGRQHWACPKCEKVFDRRSACKQHIRRHTGEKPHRCKICTVGFASKSNLKRHIGSKKCRHNSKQLEARKLH
ncbi:Zinc finger and BTB domain-containing protein 41 [Tulasnella sp. 418]|nr:Zinc finger and BTB domain-containing protein 41 [Tulasnella sp. 418]